MRRIKRSSRDMRVLVATDGSPSARRAMATVAALPWPASTRVRAVVVSDPGWLGEASRATVTVLDRSLESIAAGARRALAGRWPEAEARTVNGDPIEAILREGRRFSADVIALGWRGHGAFRRLLMGSVSRRILEQAPSSVLVARRAPREIRRVVLGIDGSPNAGRAVELAARLDGAGLVISVVRAVEPVTVRTGGLLPNTVRATVQHQAAALNSQLTRQAHRDVVRAAARLRRAGWRVHEEVGSGDPLVVLLSAIQRAKADLLIVGASAATGLRRALLGSVAAGAVDRSRAPVLVVR
jgi:nucleotide-binding universal stress UspA family protein